ncbi:carboxymuconolactone decarboxylase family protein [Arthrobacter sp. NPDC093128]|uniref:carboxymuconolactone decarboxylase family protein n=1 Tax=Arthrobacter sp. NPDC093128 TaxID=3154979 RepID=UPI00341BE8BD
MIFIVSLAVMRASNGHIQSHIRVALELGLTPTEILEAIEISLPEAGIVAFQAGLEASREVVDADGIEPTVKVHEGARGAPEQTGHRLAASASAEAPTSTR